MRLRQDELLTLALALENLVHDRAKLDSIRVLLRESLNEQNRENFNLARSTWNAAIPFQADKL